MTILPKQQITPRLSGGDIEVKRQELKSYFNNSWQTYESLFSLINNDDAYFLRPEPLRHPLIFYFGHTATFYTNKLILGKYISSRINEKLEAICAVGVDEMSWDDLDSTHYEWPSVQEVREYRQQVHSLVIQLIDTMPITLPIAQDSLAWVILMGCEHERIHLETSSVIMRMLPLTHLTNSENWPTCPDVEEGPINELIPIKGQTIELGKHSTDLTYGWDNEYGQLSVKVDCFNSSKYLVSNQEFLLFVDAGGYQKKEYWTKEGQQWLAYRKATMPIFWVKRDKHYFQRNLLTEIPLPLNWPVEVNYLEAKAFCNWKSKSTKTNIRLPTEAEWYCLRNKLPGDAPDWLEIPANTNLAYYASSAPVNRFGSGGIYDICGNVWQWTESSIDGFNGFNVHPLYDDFSTPTFDGKHNLIKGGSWISTGNEIIQSSRYAFRRHFFQHAGFRYVESDNATIPVEPVNGYETDREICQQLVLHYIQEDNFPKLLAQLVGQTATQQQNSLNKALILGCSVGGSAFELSSQFQHVDAVDFSARYIQNGVKLQQGKSVRFEQVKEGDIVEYYEISLKDLPCDYHDNVTFSQGDPVNLKPIFTGYDVIVIQQALEHSYDPKKVLQCIHRRVNDNGLVIIASDYVYNEVTTSKDKWMGGTKINGENVTGIDAVCSLMSRQFELIGQTDLIKELPINSRQSIHSKVGVSVWRVNRGE